MKILLLSTAHNSLSQRLSLVLRADWHDVTVELALGAASIIEAAGLAQPDLIICPFLTSPVPKDVFNKYMTLIVHPGAPGDAGPSALDWVLMGDDGTEPDAGKLLKRETLSAKGRSHWGVTVLQAIEEFDAGPVWGYDQFPLDIDDVTVTKSSLYRGSVTRAAVAAATAAIQRIVRTAGGQQIGPHLVADPEYRTLSVTSGQPFQGGVTHHRPLLKAGERNFDVFRHSAREISRRIRASDSQPGCLSSVFGPTLYLYGGQVEEGDHVPAAEPGTIIGERNSAVCLATADCKGIWITHLRRIKRKIDAMLWPKVPAVLCLEEQLFLDKPQKLCHSQLPSLPVNFVKAPYPTFQETHVEYTTSATGQDIAYLTSDFYNGAMSTAQCNETVAALDSILAHHVRSPLSAVVLLGGAGYFSNGIHLNVIEAASDPSLESWANINAIDDVCYRILHEFSARRIVTVAALRGNVAAGGVAIAAGCDHVVAGHEVVLNPAYRALGLHGSEYHSVAYPGRVGVEMARRLLRDMTPLSAHEAHKIGLVDVVLRSSGAQLDAAIRQHVARALAVDASRRRCSHAAAAIDETPALAEPSSCGPDSSGSEVQPPSSPLLAKRLGMWKTQARVDLSVTGLARARMEELAGMGLDIWSPRAARYHERRKMFVRKVKVKKTPARFAKHRGGVDEEETEAWDDVEFWRERERERDKKGWMHELGKLAVVDESPSIFGCYYEGAKGK